MMLSEAGRRALHQPRQQERMWRPRTAGSWKEDANCREFHDFTEWQDPREQKKVCGRCLVQGECLEWALATHSDGQFGGMFGGLTIEELKSVQRRQRKARREQLSEPQRVAQMIGANRRNQHD